MATRTKYSSVSPGGSLRGGRTSLFNDDLPDILLTWFIQVLGLTAALVFGVFACLSWVDSQRAKDQANAANLLSIAAICAQVGRNNNDAPNDAIQAICGPFFSSAWPNLSAAVEKLLPYTPVRPSISTTTTSSSIQTSSSTGHVSMAPSSTSASVSSIVTGRPNHSSTGNPPSSGFPYQSSGAAASSSVYSTRVGSPTFPSSSPHGATTSTGFPQPSAFPTNGARPGGAAPDLISTTGQKIGLGVGIGVALICVVVSTLTWWKLRRRAARQARGEFEPLQMVKAEGGPYPGFSVGSTG